MKASEAKIGHKYLTQKSVAVTKTGEKDGKIVMTMTNGMVFRCGPDYELKLVGEPKVKFAPVPKRKPAAANAPHFTMASIIDPLLLAGGHTVAEIAAELGRKAGDAATGKDLEANVRARLVSYSRKGWQLVKDDRKRVKVVQGK